MKKARLLIIRHAESVANTQGIYQGQSYDTPLSPLGERQASAVANCFVARIVAKNEINNQEKIEIDCIIASPLKRTMQTAKSISENTGVRILTHNAILETNHGEWEGHTIDWIKKNYPDEYKTWLNNPSQVKFPNGESFSEVKNRVHNFILNREWRDTTVIVTHDNIVRLMICFANNISVDNMWSIELDPAAISEFEIENKKLTLVKSNDTKYLENVRSDLTKHAL